MPQDRTSHTASNLAKALGVTTIVALTGLLVLAQTARLIPRPEAVGHPAGTMTAPMFQWMVAVMVIGFATTAALVVVGAKVARSRFVVRHLQHGLHHATPHAH